MLVMRVVHLPATSHTQISRLSAQHRKDAPVTTADWNAVDAGGAAFVLAVNEHGKTVPGAHPQGPVGL